MWSPSPFGTAERDGKDERAKVEGREGEGYPNGVKFEEAVEVARVVVEAKFCHGNVPCFKEVGAKAGRAFEGITKELRRALKGSCCCCWRRSCCCCSIAANSVVKSKSIGRKGNSCRHGGDEASKGEGRTVDPSTRAENFSKSKPMMSASAGRAG